MLAFFLKIKHAIFFKDNYSVSPTTYSWPLDKRGLNCTDPLIGRFLFSVEIKPALYIWGFLIHRFNQCGIEMVDSATTQIQREDYNKPFYMLVEYTRILVIPEGFWNQTPKDIEGQL